MPSGPPARGRHPAVSRGIFSPHLPIRTRGTATRGPSGAERFPLEETVRAQGFTGQLRYLRTVRFDLLPGDGPRIEPTPIPQIAA